MLLLSPYFLGCSQDSEIREVTPDSENSGTLTDRHPLGVSFWIAPQEEACLLGSRVSLDARQAQRFPGPQVLQAAGRCAGIAH